ncbi:major facilitator superfamily domain-containing protein [Mariannaea sp. PMI_226]|nr:major facilitator superfamily domain-containing protein [Mariannaea sp. PMI_226]
MTDETHPSGLRLGLILISVFTSMFLVSLDRLIITTAIPQITDEFKSVGDIGWYGSAYLLTTCASQLLFGKIYSLFSNKLVFLITISLFEVGSAVCGSAPNSVAFIVGRAIAGVGGAGIYSGALMVIIHTVPLHKRPLYQGMFGAVFGVSSVVGPLLGGAFTSRVSWRWCFYINLPLGAVAIVIILFLLKIPPKKETRLSTKAKIAQLDVYGSILIVPGSVCAILALQWGGLTYPWHDGRIIALLTLAGLLFVGFVLVQFVLPKTATIPPRIFKQRSILAGLFSTLCIGSQQVIFIYYLPIWFQAIQGVSAIESGIRILPLILSMVAASVLSGVLVRHVGYYTPFLLGGVCFMCVGAGLLNTLQPNTAKANWISYQILYGWGFGLGSQAPNLAAQTVLAKADIPIGASLMFFSQLLGGAIFISVGQNVFESQLHHRLASVLGFDLKAIQKSGATSLTDLPPSIKPTVLVAYNESLRHVFRVGLVLVCATVIGASSMEWRSVKKNIHNKGGATEREDKKLGEDDNVAAEEK